MLTRLALEATERGCLPDPLVRRGIHRLLRERLAAERRGTPGAREQARADFAAGLSGQPLAVATVAANTQHY